MILSKTQADDTEIRVVPVNQDNWRAVAGLEVKAAQQAFVASPSYYLALCCYGGVWQPLAFTLKDQVVGFCMWGIDEKDSSCWLGGILIDAKHQGKGYGKRAVKATIDMLNRTLGLSAFALSYEPTNVLAKRVYTSLGFVETGEREENEVVARLRYRHP